MEDKINSILTKNKAATSFFTMLANKPGCVITVPGNLESVIVELEKYLGQAEVSEIEKHTTDILLQQYKRLRWLTLLATCGDHNW